MSHADSIHSLLKEERLYPPPAEFARNAHIKSREEYDETYAHSIQDPVGYWSDVAHTFHWFRCWEKGLEWNRPHAKWFVGGQTNISYNCLDRNIDRGLADKTAILFEGEPGDVQRLTFRELLVEVCRFANALKSLGVNMGDRVTIYMPMIPQAAIAMLACARIGAPHSVIFGGFSVQAIVDRVEDAQSHVVITADGGWRRGKVVPLKENVDQAADLCPLIKKVVVYQRIGSGAAHSADSPPADRPSQQHDQRFKMMPGRDFWWHDLVAHASHECPAEMCDSEDMLFLLYTSGSTGKPKGIVHTTAGYMIHTAHTAKTIFDLKPDDVYWCTADVGWITGHSYVVYGILANGVTTLMYEGAPSTPDWDRFWSIIERHKVTKFYTAPTAIRAFMREGRAYPDKHDLSSLKLLGTVGEPINPEAWVWYHEVIGRERCPIVDTWWQTETGGIMIAPVPGAIATKPGTATRPFFGIDPAVMSKTAIEAMPAKAGGLHASLGGAAGSGHGTASAAADDPRILPANTGGLLCIRQPWPGMLRGIWGDTDRFVKQYWSEIDGVYFAGDSSRMDEDGYFWIMGRVDDVIKVSGHRLGTMEVESALVAHVAVAEAAVVGIPHDIKGNAIAAFVTLVTGMTPTGDLKLELEKHVAHMLGAVARPEQIRFTQSLPKTRSGKIMRRLLREVATSGEVKGDTTTLEDFSVLAKLAEKEE